VPGTAAPDSPVPDTAVPDSPVPDRECLICSMEEADPASRVFLDELWAAEVAPGYEVPGWFFLRARRHAEKLTGLDDAETAAFGPHARDLVSAVEQVTGAPAVYLLSFGESYLHFHALVAARGEQVPPELRGGALLRLLASGRDVAAAQALAKEVRLAYERRNPHDHQRSSHPA
jgi:diadenosine tetraphosphate (Ap4A) HIT family hydrolase